MIQWARQALINHGLAEKCGHFVWRLTEAGVGRAAEYKSIAPNGEVIANALSTTERAVAFNQPPAIFKKVDYRLEGLLNYIEQGDLGLPELQRPFVWSPTKVRDLLDSMYRGFPIGHLLFWENPGTKGTKFIGVEGKQQTAPQLLIVDGQQRLTSLYAVFTGAEVLDDTFQKARLEIAFRPRDSKFEVTDAAIKKDPEFVENITDILTKPAAFTVVADFLKELETKKTITEEDRKAIAYNLGRLFELKAYPLSALQIDSSADEEAVADIFVRTNSAGTKLNQADFILTLLSVFWEDGRKALERFSQASRLPPSGGGSSPFNYLIRPEPSQLLRVAIAVGFNRGRLRSVYQILRGKDPESDTFSPALRDKQYARLREAQEKVLDLNYWHDFLSVIQSAGFRSEEMISSENALLYSYAFYIIGRTKFSVALKTLQRLIARWFFATALTGRYTGSSETAVEEDLNRIKNLTTGNDFINDLKTIIDATLTNDFWTITLPTQLDTSSANSPSVFAYIASQACLGAQVLFSDKKIGDVLDPSIKPKKKLVEQHHLFPRGWLEKNGITSRAMINQAANFALLEWPDNMAISDDPPGKYVPEMKKRLESQMWDKMCYLHALPVNWEELSYQEFLGARRELMARQIRAGFQVLSGEQPVLDLQDVPVDKEESLAWEAIKNAELAMRKLVRLKYDFRWKQQANNRMRKVLGEDAWTAIEKMRQKGLSQYPLSSAPEDHELLNYCYLGQLVSLILASDAWDLFKPLFTDKHQLENIVQSIMPVRNDKAHFRPVPLKELQRCRIASDDLIALLSKEQLVNSGSERIQQS
jgi:hypothetical protein